MGFLQYKKISFTRTNDNESLDAKHNPNKLSYDTKPKIIHQETDDMTITTPENKKSKSPTIIPGFGNWSFSLFYDETDLSITPLMSSGTTTYDKVVDKNVGKL